MTGDANLLPDLGSLDPSLSVFSTSANSITIVSNVPGDPLPVDTLEDFIIICFNNIETNPIELVVWAAAVAILSSYSPE